jgi:hypothetical protein
VDRQLVLSESNWTQPVPTSPGFELSFFNVYQNQEVLANFGALKAYEIQVLIRH